MIETRTKGSETTTEAFPPPIVEGVKAAIESTYSMICGNVPRLLPPELSEAHCDCVMGIIAFNGTVPWTLSMILPPDTCAKLSEKFIGFPVAFDSPDLGDVVGELVNILAGDVGAQLEMRKIHCQMSLPTVARGHGLELLLSPSLPHARLGFSSEEGVFWFELMAARPGSSSFCRPSGG